MPDFDRRSRKSKLEFQKDESIDPGRIYPFRVALGPFVFRLYAAFDQFFHESSNYTMMRHSHRNFELHCFVGGDGFFEANDNVFEVRPRSFCVIGPWIYHMQRQAQGAPSLKYSFQFDYAVEGKTPAVLRAARRSPAAKALSALTCFYEPDGEKICALAESLKRELASPDAFSEYRIQNILSDVMIELLRSLVKENDFSSLAQSGGDMRDLKIEIFFDEHYEDAGLTEQEMARAIGISARHLNRMIQKNYGLTFKQKLTRTRIESAKGFLAGTDSSVESIAENTGFHSSEYFYKAFRKETGMTPGEYRRVHRSG